MTAFDFSMRTQLVFGPGSVTRIGDLARSEGAQRVFLITDSGIVSAGHVDRVEKLLAEAGLECRRFDAVPSNPSSSDVDRCRAALGTWDADLLIGLGGGSSIDAAKGCNFLRAGGGRMEDYWGVGKARGEFLPLIAVPTTAGTGTEVQSFALISQDGTDQKMACGDPRATPKIAILDPVLTLTQPRPVTACTGIDALGHAVETAVTKSRTELSQVFSTAAFGLIVTNLPRVLERPDDVEARGLMLRAAAFAGIAIENSMLGAAHSMANPLTAHYGIEHGQAVGMCLPAVVRFNQVDQTARGVYAELARGARLCDVEESDADAAAAMALCIDSLLRVAGFDASLSACGVPGIAAQDLAKEAAQQWTAQFNPRPVTAVEFEQLFAAALA